MEKNTAFAKSLELDYPILSNPDGKVAAAYGVVDAKRKFPRRWTIYIGKDGRILKIDKKVRPRSAAEDVAKILEELGVEKK